MYELFGGFEKGRAMINPLLALGIGSGILVLLGLIFWPESGYLWQLRRRQRLTERVLMEDALKYLHKCERHQISCAAEGLAGALSISRDKALELIDRAHSKGLVVMQGNQFHLTETGRDTAVQIVRAHRLWEKYLADATGFSEQEWHQQAERFEHQLSVEEIDRLSASLGNPTHDPHGDPIPTARGEFINHGGIPLTDLRKQVPARIVHIEDEPDVVYAQLIAEGLHPQQVIEVEEISQQRVRFWSEDQEHILAPVVAANLSVIPLVRDQEIKDARGVPLHTLSTGQRGKVTGISSACRGVERRRLLDLGVIPGTEIEVEMISPGGDPTAYRIRGSVIALRSKQAAMILVEPEKDNHQKSSPGKD